ncbi:alkK, partial [Symbiodinium pilosum]
DLEPLLLSRICDRGVELQPENLIVTRTQSGYVKQTYAEHGRRAKQLASALSKWGVKIEDRVATLMWNTGWHFECYHAISCMGAVLHTLNLRLSAADQNYIISHAQDRIIIADAVLLKNLAEVDPAVLASVELFICVGEDGEPGKWSLPPELDVKKAVDYETFLATGSEDFQWPLVPETSTMGLCYTSGTTGRPKGVGYSQRSTYLHTLMSNGVDQLAISGRQVVLPFVPMFHVLSWGVPFNILMMGCRAVFPSSFTDAGSLLQAMGDWKVQLSCGVPTVWQGVRSQIEKEGLAQWKPKLALQRLVCGGSAPAPEMMRWYL